MWHYNVVIFSALVWMAFFFSLLSRSGSICLILIRIYVDIFVDRLDDLILWNFVPLLLLPLLLSLSRLSSWLLLWLLSSPFRSALCSLTWSIPLDRMEAALFFYLISFFSSFSLLHVLLTHAEFESKILREEETEEKKLTTSINECEKNGCYKICHLHKIDFRIDINKWFQIVTQSAHHIMQWPWLQNCIKCRCRCNCKSIHF